MYDFGAQYHTARCNKLGVDYEEGGKQECPEKKGSESD